MGIFRVSTWDALSHGSVAKIGVESCEFQDGTKSIRERPPIHVRRPSHSSHDGCEPKNDTESVASPPTGPNQFASARITSPKNSTFIRKSFGLACLAFSVGLASALGGCSSLINASGVSSLQGEPPAKLTKTDTDNVEHVVAQWKAAYYSSSDASFRATTRNQILFELLDTNDKKFSSFEYEVWGAQGGVSTLSDWAVLILTGIASANPGASPALAAAVSGITGAHLSLEKNFLYDQTVASLLVSIEISRAQIRSHIVSCLAQPDSAYPLYVALDNEGQYERMAVLPSAVARLTASSTVPNIATKSCLSDASLNPVQSLRGDLRTKISSLSAADLATLRLIIGDLGITLASPSTLASDQNAVISWMNNATNSDIARLNASVQKHLGPASEPVVSSPVVALDQALRNLPSSITAAQLEGAMKIAGITATSPGALDRDEFDIRTWGAQAAPATVSALAATVNALVPPSATTTPVVLNSPATTPAATPPATTTPATTTPATTPPAGSH